MNTFSPKLNTITWSFWYGKITMMPPKDGEGQVKFVVLTMNTYFRGVVRISMNAIENINLKTDVKDKA